MLVKFLYIPYTVFKVEPPDESVWNGWKKFTQNNPITRGDNYFVVEFSSTEEITITLIRFPFLKIYDKDN